MFGESKQAVVHNEGQSCSKYRLKTSLSFRNMQDWKVFVGKKDLLEEGMI
jgi:hypothetical protein